jgi:hypothetical protein
MSKTTLTWKRATSMNDDWETPAPQGGRYIIRSVQGSRGGPLRHEARLHGAPRGHVYLGEFKTADAAKRVAAAHVNREMGVTRKKPARVCDNCGKPSRALVRRPDLAGEPNAKVAGGYADARLCPKCNADLGGKSVGGKKPVGGGPRLAGTLSRTELLAASKTLRARGLKLPAMGMGVRMPDGRELMHDRHGYYLIGFVGDGGVRGKKRGTSFDPEACPGCGSRPGDGLTPGCHDEAGCGYYRRLEQAEAQKRAPLHQRLKAARRPATFDPEACPGCGCRPGDGLTPGCNHPMGCGYTRNMGGKKRSPSGLGPATSAAEGFAAALIGLAKVKQLRERGLEVVAGVAWSDELRQQAIGILSLAKFQKLKSAGLTVRRRRGC